MDHTRHNSRCADLDDRSDISPLQCGSIPPLPEYDPSLNPINVAFVPPLEISVKGKVEIPDWLRLDGHDDGQKHPTLERVSSAPSDRPDTNNDVRRQVSWDSRRVESRDASEINDFPCTVLRGIHYSQQKPCHEPLRCTKSMTSSRTSLTTSPSDLSSDDENDECIWLDMVPERRTVDVKLITGTQKFPLFHKRRRNVSLRRSRGCLT